MSVNHAIVVGVDGTSDSALALRWAVADAHVRRLPLHVVHAYQPPVPIYSELPAASVPVDESGVRRHAEEVLATALRQGREQCPDVEVSGEVVRGHRTRVLLETSAGAAALVVGSRRLGAVGGTVLGSVGLAVAARARCPVVVLRGPDGHPSEGARVVVGVDGTPLSEPVLDYAFDHASHYRVPLRAVLCWRPHPFSASQWTDAAAAEAVTRHRALLAEALAGWQEKYPDVTVERQVIRGHPTNTLVAEAYTAHLLVVGARGHHATADALLGSVSQGVLHHATCPVAVIHARPGRDDDR